MDKCEGCGTETVHADDCPALDPPDQPLRCLRTKPHRPHMYMLNRTARPCPGVPDTDLYFCPTVGEIESATHGGFSVCCTHPERHVMIGHDTPAITAISTYLSKRAQEDFSGPRLRAETVDTTDSPGPGVPAPVHDCPNCETQSVSSDAEVLRGGRRLFNTTDPEPPAAPADNVLEYVTQALARHDLTQMSVLLEPGDEIPTPKDHPFWTMWRTTARNAIMAYNVYAEQRSGHRYLSTGCLHGEHGYCQSNTGSQGQKTPAVCKFCQAPCVCSCHLPGEVTVVERTVNKTVWERIEEYHRAGAGEWCGAMPPGGAGAEFTTPDGSTWGWGDCVCTKTRGHNGDHQCDSCTKRHGAPSWPQEDSDDRIQRSLDPEVQREIFDRLHAKNSRCEHDAEHHGPETGCVECPCTSTTGHEETN